MTNKPNVIVVFGPTASGKTSLSLRLAEVFDGVVINGDSRQVYKHMPLITAMPSEKEMSSCSHELFEFLEPDESYDVTKYLEDVRQQVGTAAASNQTPIICGGTGFYLKVLEEGISPMPEVSSSIIEALNARQKLEGTAVLYAELQEVDSELAGRLEPENTQRIIRGLAVYEASNRKLSDWQKEKPVGALDVNFIKIGILPEREVMYNRIHQRFDVMMENGLLDEMKNLRTLGYDENTLALQSLGVKELFAYLDGAVSLDFAKEEMLKQTRRYAKRQCTWLRHQFKADIVLNKADEPKLIELIKEKTHA